MGRNKKYDTDLLIQNGIELFRKKGFHNTSSEDIVQTLGIPKGSFYGIYKTKENFGVRALEQYVEDTLQFMDKMLYQNRIKSPLKRLTLFYKSLSEFFTQEGCAYGCLLNNCSLELAGYNNSFREAIKEGHKRFINKIEPCVREAQEKGELITHVESWDLTYLMHTSFDGAIVKMKGSGNSDALNIFLNNFFKLIRI